MSKMTTLGRHVCCLSRHNFVKFRYDYVKTSQLHTSCRRYLFSPDFLGVENFKRQRSLTNEKVGDLKEKFRSRMEEYMSSATKNTIFTDDLKTIIYIAENEDDFATAEKMMKRFHKQDAELRFSNFTFGPLVMRLLHILNLPDKSYELFKDEELSGFFDQMISCTHVMDLQFESGRYAEVLEILDLIGAKKLGGYQYPVDCVTVAMAACLKMNTPESFSKAQTVLKECSKSDSNISRRSVIYACMLALKQNAPEIAREILSLASTNRGRRVVAHENMKVLVNLALGQVEEAMLLLRLLLEEDVPDHILRGNEFFREVVTAVGDAVKRNGSVELNSQYVLILKGLENGNHITDASFEDFLFRPIVRQRQLQDGYKSRSRPSLGGYKFSQNRKAYRPSLVDREDKFPL